MDFALFAFFALQTLLINGFPREASGETPEARTRDGCAPRTGSEERNTWAVYQPTELRWPCLVMRVSSSQTARPFFTVVRLSWKV